ncbi:hypothetical protein PRI8871_01547 [Pseudoprimorskyibacter insulae]|uniref:Thioesterase domain-containing protein n=2 Tax=Pseudoprimorskyibacter insulae TaxID=1695997 RepID=A0A2R8AUT6_9RHOB|nr:hypothetical protein PRI8871_01547 [Pseudoprimorskyibacter insulae]
MTTRAAYPAFVALQTRWSDNDEYGHMNNAAYYQLFDTAVSNWQQDNGLIIRGPNATRFVVVENGCKYHRETGYPHPLQIGLRIPHIGRSSVRFDLGLFQDDQDTPCATGFFAMVHVGDTGQSAPLPDPVRAIFQRLATPA